MRKPGAVSEEESAYIGVYGGSASDIIVGSDRGVEKETEKIESSINMYDDGSGSRKFSIGMYDNDSRSRNSSSEKGLRVAMTNPSNVEELLYESDDEELELKLGDDMHEDDYWTQQIEGVVGELGRNRDGMAG